MNKKLFFSSSIAVIIIITSFLAVPIILAKVEEPLPRLTIDDRSIPFQQAVTQTMVFEANLSGAKEVGPVDTLASGRAVLAISDTATDTLYYRVMVRDIQNVTLAHIHQGAPGTNGGIIFTLFDGTGDFDPDNPISGTLTLTPTQIATLLAGDYYVNVHTTDHPTGEIRGQIGPYTPPSAFNALLAGANERPTPVDTPAKGVSHLTLNDLNTLAYTLAVTNITDVTMAHIHLGSVDESGPVVITLDTGTLSPSNPVSGTAPLTSADRIVNLLTNFYYVNVHTTANPGGEIRGQIGGERVFQAVLSGAEEVPAVNTNASGRAVLGLSADATTLYYRLLVNDISGISLAHIHQGPAGQNGPVIFTLYDGSGPFDPSNPISGTITTNLSTDELFNLLADNFYVNVHTGDNPGGEIRGQIHPFTLPSHFNATLAGGNEVGPVDTSASGQGRFTLTDLNMLHYIVTVADITGVSMAHIHLGPVGQNGPIIFTLYGGPPGTFDPDNPVGGAVALNYQNLVDLLTDFYYANVHTAAHPGGEIRGQITGPRVYLPTLVKE